MAHITKEGYLETTDEDKEALREGVGKNWAKRVIYKIVWGEKLSQEHINNCSGCALCEI